MTIQDEITDNSFENFMDDVTPIKDNDHVHFDIPNKTTLAQTLKRQAINENHLERSNYLSVESVTPVDPYDMLEYKQHGIQDRVYKKLRLGKYSIDDSLNIQNTQFKKARQLVFEKITQGHNDGVRMLLIKHGLGLHTKPFPSFLKSYVNQWLRQIPEVIAFHSAQKRHGGLASVYVLLKKNRADKVANSEIHRKHG